MNNEILVKVQAPHLLGSEQHNISRPYDYKMILMEKVMHIRNRYDRTTSVVRESRRRYLPMLLTLTNPKNLSP